MPAGEILLTVLHVVASPQTPEAEAVLHTALDPVLHGHIPGLAAGSSSVAGEPHARGFVVVEVFLLA